MPIRVHPWAPALALVLLSMLAIQASAADQDSQGKTIVQSGTSGVPVDGKTVPLSLSDDQRTRIRQVLATKHTEVDLASKENEKAKDFEAHIDDAIPKGLEAEAFPQPLISEIPETKRYTYLKFKGQVLIVNPMTHKVVDMFPEH
jgi:hypothetical protein